jgi:D-alanyl-D-alanine carboxypeptidase (penicillin-binding protein 5/6)
MGDKETVDLGILQDTPINIPRGLSKNLKANFKLDKSLQAPIAKGEVVGKLYLQIEGEDIAEYPLVALQEIKEGDFFDRMVDFVKLKLGFNN